MSEFQPYEPDEPAQPPKTQVRLVMAAVLLTFVALAIWGFTWARGQWGGDEVAATTTVTVTTTPSAPATTAGTPTPSVQIATPVSPTADPTSPSTATSTSSPTTSRPAVALPRGARVCDGSSEVRAAAGTPRTSCSFAQSVRDAWVAAGKGDRTVRAHSSVTDQDYNMACSGSPLTTCRGGNRAVVYLY